MTIAEPTDRARTLAEDFAPAGPSGAVTGLLCSRPGCESRAIVKCSGSGDRLCMLDFIGRIIERNGYEVDRAERPHAVDMLTSLLHEVYHRLDDRDPVAAKALIERAAAAWPECGNLTLVPVSTDTPTPDAFASLVKLAERFREQQRTGAAIAAGPGSVPWALAAAEVEDEIERLRAVAARVPDTPTAVEVEDPTLLIRAVLLAVTDNALACNAGITIEDMCRYAETGELNDLIEARLAAAAPVGTEPDEDAS